MRLLYAIRDQKANCFPYPPFAAQARGEGIRMFVDLVNDERSSVCKHPEDYELFELGSWDEATGVLIPAPTGIQALGNGLSYRQDKGPALVREA